MPWGTRSTRVLPLPGRAEVPTGTPQHRGCQGRASTDPSLPQLMSQSPWGHLPNPTGFHGEFQPHGMCSLPREFCCPPVLQVHWDGAPQSQAGAGTPPVPALLQWPQDHAGSGITLAAAQQQDSSPRAWGAFPELPQEPGAPCQELGTAGDGAGPWDGAGVTQGQGRGQRGGCRSVGGVQGGGVRDAGGIWQDTLPE